MPSDLYWILFLILVLNTKRHSLNFGNAIFAAQLRGSNYWNFETEHYQFLLWFPWIISILHRIAFSLALWWELNRDWSSASLDKCSQALLILLPENEKRNATFVLYRVQEISAEYSEYAQENMSAIQWKRSHCIFLCFITFTRHEFWDEI